MWSLKAHYCFWFGSLSGILPYVSVFAKTHMGVTTSTMGTLFFVLPVVASFLKPLACSAADHYSKHSHALLIAQLGTLIGYGLLIIIPFLVPVLPAILLFYLYCFFVLIGNTAMGVGISLTDHLVMYEVNRVKQSGGETNYGSFRIWGTIGFGVFGILSGYINEFIQDTMYLLPGLLMFLAIEGFDIFCIYQFYHLPNKRGTLQPSDDNLEVIENQTPSGLFPINKQSIKSVQPFWTRIKTRLQATRSAIKIVLRQVINIYWHYPTLIQYTFVIFCYGILTAFHWSYFFWFLEEIRGKDTLLFGLCIAVESFVGEIPIFLIAHKIIAAVGPIMSLCISLGTFGFRFLCYGFLLDIQKDGNGSYWEILLIETLQGITFSLFYTVMTHVAQYYADKCDKIYQTVVECESRASLNANSVHSLASTIDDQVEGENESHMIGDSRINTLQPMTKQTNGFNAQNSIKPSATMQSLMSACYEGVGLAIGSFVGGRVIDRIGFFQFWRIAGYMSLALVAFNLGIELIKWVHSIRIEKSKCKTINLPTN